MHFCALRWPSWLGRQTHRVYRASRRRHLRHLEIVGSDPTRSIPICSFSMIFSHYPSFWPISSKKRKKPKNVVMWRTAAIRSCRGMRVHLPRIRPGRVQGNRGTSVTIADGTARASCPDDEAEDGGDCEGCNKGSLHWITPVHSMLHCGLREKGSEQVSYKHCRVPLLKGDCRKEEIIGLNHPFSR